jgi:hypothetical protein
MRTLRLSLAGTVVPALLAGLGVAVLAQADSAYSTGGTWMSLVEEQCRTTTAYNRVNQPNGDYQVRDLGVTCAAPGDDPRLGEYMTYELNEDCFADGGCINWGPISQEGPDGSWSGWFAGTEDPDADTYITIVMTGAGGYEGLTHIRHATGPFDALDHAGVIYEGDPPPLLAMPDASTE